MTEEQAQYVVDQVNARIGAHLRFDRLYHTGVRQVVMARDKHNREHALVFSLWTLEHGPTVVMRSVLRRQNPRRDMRWGPNGQAGRGAVTVEWWPERRFDIPLSEMVDKSGAA